MTKPVWTAAELKEFDRLTRGTSSRDQMRRINARIEMPRFVAEHGKEKCDAMWAHLTEKGGAA